MHLNSEEHICAQQHLSIYHTITRGISSIMAKCNTCSIRIDLDCVFLDNLSVLANTDLVRSVTSYDDTPKNKEI